LRSNSNAITKARNTNGGKYHCTVDLLFDWFGISCMTTDNFCCYLINRLIQTSKTGGKWYSYTSPFSIPWPKQNVRRIVKGEHLVEQFILLDIFSFGNTATYLEQQLQILAPSPSTFWTTWSHRSRLQSWLHLIKQLLAPTLLLSFSANSFIRSWSYTVWKNQT